MCGKFKSQSRATQARCCILYGLDYGSSRAGENFFAWLKSRKPALADGCPKKITVHEAAVKSGENAFCRRGVSGWHRRC
jgi:hypothetical protein